MNIYKNIIQGTPEWFDVRKGKMTASHATAIGNCGKGLQTYVRSIVKEMIVPPVYYSNKDIERGNEYEPLARSTYEFEYGVNITQIGFAEYNKYVGCSPDGLIGQEGGLEIKARNDDIHFGLLMGDSVDSSTIWQMNMNMLILKSAWWDFVSYNPNFKTKLFVKRFHPDNEKFDKLYKGFGLGEKMIKQLLENQYIKLELNG